MNWRKWYDKWGDRVGTEYTRLSKRQIMHPESTTNEEVFQVTKARLIEELRTVEHLSATAEHRMRLIDISEESGDHDNAG